MTRWFAPFCGLLLLGCTPKDETGLIDDETDDPCEEGCDTAEVIPTQVDVVKVGAGSAGWIYDVLLRGWGDVVTMDIVGEVEGYGTWTEYHELRNLEASVDDHSWDRWGGTFPIVADPKKQTSGESTYFPSDDTTQEAMTWMITAYEYGTGELAECVVDGADVTLFEEYDCFWIKFLPYFD